VDSHDILTLAVEARTHGRVLVRAARLPPQGGGPRVLVGFHGYYENAAIQMERLAALPGSDRWTLVAVQGLHRFYRARTEDVVASWMTRQDRELAIADNIAYIDAAIEAAAGGVTPRRIVCVGFSQGVAMAFRAGVRGRAKSDAIVGVGADVPPELLADSAAVFPPVLLIRGAQDPYYPQQMFDGNIAALRQRGANVTPLVVNAAHDWTADVAHEASAFINRVDD
jgi:predicted esterase